MSLLLNIFGSKVGAVAQNEDEIWRGNSVGRMTPAGVTVGPSSALTISTVWACVTLLAETIAALPLNVLELLPDGSGRKRAIDHPIYKLLKTTPNEKQTAFEFKQIMIASLLLRGDAYAVIVPGADGYADQLIWTDSDTIKTVRLQSGGYRYEVRTSNGPKRYLPDEVLHLRGFSTDGVKGISVIEMARLTMGISLAAEKYGAEYFGNDSTPGGVLQAPGTVTKAAGKILKQGWEEANGPGRRHGVAILPGGVEWKQIGLTNKDSQFLETREFQAEEICRWFRVPPVLVGLTSKSTSWGSGIEQMGIGFVRYTLVPWLTRLEQGLARALLIHEDKYYIKHNVDSLVRGTLGERYAAYNTGRMGGWLSRNEIRRYEDLQDVEGGNDYLTPLNMEQLGSERAGLNAASYAQDSQVEFLIREAAGRVVRREIATLTTRNKNSKDSWDNNLEKFYGSHTEYIIKALPISMEAAKIYIYRAVCELKASGPTGLTQWAINGQQYLIDAMTSGEGGSGQNGY